MHSAEVEREVRHRVRDVDALATDGGAVSETLLDMARAAVRAVLP